jgi:hypothetical protein
MDCEWVWIRILGSLQWLTDLDPDPDPGLFVSDSQDAKKKVFLSLFVSLITFCRYGTYISIFLVYRSKDPDSALFVSDSQDANKK